MDIEARLQNFISQELLSGSRQVEAGENLLEGGLIDSVGTIRLLGFIQDEWDVTVPAEDFVIENFESVIAMRRYLEPRMPTT